MEPVALTRSFGHVKVYLFTEINSLGITCGICPSSSLLSRCSDQGSLLDWEKAYGYGPEIGTVLWFCPKCQQTFMGWNNNIVPLEFSPDSLATWVAIWLGLQLVDVSIEVELNP